MKSADPNQSPGSREENTGDRIRDTGREAMSDATNEVRSRMERGKTTAAESAASTSEVLDHAAEDFSAHGQETLARATSVLAGKLSDLANQIENRSIDELSQDAMRLARSNPGLFVAGGVALGLALSRFVKASAPGSRSTSESGQLRSGAAYGGEGALPSQGTGAGTSVGAGTSTGGGAGTSTAGSTEGAHGPARAPTSSSNPASGNPIGTGGRHE